MSSPSALNQQIATAPVTPLAATSEVTAQPLNNEHEQEALAFLAARPLHTVFLRGLIHDNGLVSALNRGDFYGCRDAEGRLEGVALIGHAMLIEAHTQAALQAFAAIAQNCQRAHVIMGEMEKIQTFWSYYAEGGQALRLACRELLFEQRWPVEVRKEVRGLRRATLRDLEMVMPVHAEMAHDESGVNPMEKDANGFRLRCARRIEQGRVWVLIENGRLIFKADIVSDTPDVVYLEGIYVAPEERGNGIGYRCLSQLTRNLLARTKSVSLLVNEQNETASAFYQKVGFKLRAHYDTIFLQQASA